MKHFLLAIVIAVASIASAQQYTSIHHEQAVHYANDGIEDGDYTKINRKQSDPNFSKQNRSSCNLEKVVFGWHPYWSNGKEDQYDWDLMTDLSFFSYEVDPNTGDPLTTHGWSTNDAVDSALANGLRVNLCVTLFSSHTTFFGNPTSVQNLITNLISLVQARSAHGVNIDFEGIPSSQATNFTNFMIDLANQMHTAIPSSQVSTVLYAVDWNNVFNIAALDPYVDLFTIMGYAYYYSGSSTAGPTDPLYTFTTGYNTSLSKTVTYYLDQGVTPSKLILGLPYYGYEWPVASTNIPSSTTGSGSAKTLQQVRNNTNGYYDPINETWEYNAISTNYTFNNGGTRQCFINDEYDMRERLELIKHRDIGGMAIWALGYDYNYNEYWNAIYEEFTDCGVEECTDTIYDMGGPTRDYYDDEDYTYTITADNASSLTLTFDSIDIEATYDFLYVYDGPDVNAPQISGSPFSGQYSGFTWTSSGPEVTFRFTSDGATNNSGWKIVYTCNQDFNPPATSIDNQPNWVTADFNQTFTDQDNSGGSGIAESYYQVTHNNAVEWRSTSNLGFYNDEFDNGIHSDWTSVVGNWISANGNLEQNDEAESNTNLYAALNQNNADQWLFHWEGNISGSGTNKRAGFHFMSDDGSLPNRGNSYFVWFRTDSDKIQIYKVINDVFSLEADIPYVLDESTWYDIKTTYNKTTGRIGVYVNDEYAASWTDSSPYQSGDYISFRSGNAVYTVDNLRIYHNRNNSETITVGTGAMMAEQNEDPFSPAGQVRSVVIDSAYNISQVDNQLYNVDWTEAGPVTVLDGFSVEQDTFNDPNSFTAHWQAVQDTQSMTVEYWYALGSTPGDSNIVAWTNNGLNTIFTESGLSLVDQTTYYASVRTVNGAGIVSGTFASDGNLLFIGTGINELDANFSIFPNPASDMIQIEFDNALDEDARLEIVDVRGRVIQSQMLSKELNSVQLDVTNLSSGRYEVVIQSKTFTSSVGLFKR